MKSDRRRAGFDQKDEGGVDGGLTSGIAEAFEPDPKGMLLDGACLPAKRFGSERSGAGNALLDAVP